MLKLMEENRQLTEAADAFEERLHHETRRAEKRRLSAENRAELEVRGFELRLALPFSNDNVKISVWLCGVVVSAISRERSLSDLRCCCFWRQAL